MVKDICNESRAWTTCNKIKESENLLSNEEALGFHSGAGDRT